MFLLGAHVAGLVERDARFFSRNFVHEDSKFQSIKAILFHYFETQDLYLLHEVRHLAILA
jgi:hypothetical protein